jgi:hypothetical protein
MFYNKDEYKVQNIGLGSQHLSNYNYDRMSVEYGARKMAEMNKIEMRKHEQSILWKFEHILGKLVLDPDSFLNITDEFKKVLINEF